MAVVGEGTVWPGATTINYKDIRDGSSITIFVVENVGSGIQWTEPRDLDFSDLDRFVADPVHFGISSPFAPPAVLMGDGTARSLPEHLNPHVLKALLTIAGGEPIDYDDLTEIADGRLRPRKE